jgi:hypothetical protein
MASQEQISVHNLAGTYLSLPEPSREPSRTNTSPPSADLKNTSDDAIPNYLNSLKFKQVHTLTDTRLVLGYTAFAISAACFGWDYKFGFDNTKYYTAAAVAIYAVLNGALTYWIGFVEKGIVYQGIAPSGEKVCRTWGEPMLPISPFRNHANTGAEKGRETMHAHGS